MDYSSAAAPMFVGRQQASHRLHMDMNGDDIEPYEDFEAADMEALERDLNALGHNEPISGKSSEWSQFELSATAATFEARSASFESNSQAPGVVLTQSMAGNRKSRAQGGEQGAQQPAQPQQPQSQQQPQQHQQRTTWGLSLSGTVIQRNDFVEAANFILECKGDDAAAAIEFLRGVLGALTGQTVGLESSQWDGSFSVGPPYLSPEDQAAAQAHLTLNQQHSLLLQAQRSGLPPRPPPVFPIALLGDEVDQRLSTLVILVPGRAHIVGHLIGKGGAEVGRIEREMSVTIKIESASKMSVALMERSVCIIGSVAATTLAQQFVSHKVHEKLLSEGIQAEVLKMVVPNEIVRHLIGKSGANINRLQNESGARIQVEPESTMSPSSIGRTIVLQGAERCRTFAQYLILRQIAEDRNVHAEWAGRVPAVTPGFGHPAPGMLSPMAPPGLVSGAPMAPGPGMSPNHGVPLPMGGHASGNHLFMASLAGLASGGEGGGGGGAPQIPNLSAPPFHPSGMLPRPSAAAFVPPAMRQSAPTTAPAPAPNGHSAAAAAAAGEDPAPVSSVTMTLAEAAAQALVGRNGLTVGEIQSQSGARIAISKPSLTGAEGHVRRVTVTGTLEAVELAQEILQSKLASFYRGNGQPPAPGGE